MDKDPKNIKARWAKPLENHENLWKTLFIE